MFMLLTLGRCVCSWLLQLLYTHVGWSGCVAPTLTVCHQAELCDVALTSHTVVVLHIRVCMLLGVGGHVLVGTAFAVHPCWVMRVPLTDMHLHITWLVIQQCICFIMLSGVVVSTTDLPGECPGYHGLLSAAGKQ
jgi:hypothetical protein